MASNRSRDYSSIDPMVVQSNPRGLYSSSQQILDIINEFAGIKSAIGELQKYVFQEWAASQTKLLSSQVAAQLSPGQSVTVVIAPSPPAISMGANPYSFYVERISDKPGLAIVSTQNQQLQVVTASGGSSNVCYAPGAVPFPVSSIIVIDGLGQHRVDIDTDASANVPVITVDWKNDDHKDDQVDALKPGVPQPKSPAGKTENEAEPAEAGDGGGE